MKLLLAFFVLLPRNFVAMTSLKMKCLEIYKTFSSTSWVLKSEICVKSILFMMFLVNIQFICALCSYYVFMITNGRQGGKM